MLSPTGNFRSFWDAIGILILVKAGIFGNLWELGLDMGFFSGKSLEFWEIVGETIRFNIRFFCFFFSNRKNMKNKTDVNVDLLWFVFLPGARNGLIWMLFLARDHKIVT